MLRIRLLLVPPTTLVKD